MIKIGDLEIINPIFLAPMSGITDMPFRTICREMGAGVVYTEFVSADGIIRENTKTLNMIKFNKYERPIGVQIFGDDPDVVGKSAKIVYDRFHPDIIDINYGCPVPKVTNRGAGSAAMKNLCIMEEITQSVIEAVPSIPITVKMRAGWDDDNLVFIDAGMRLEKIGVKAITLHPRTTKQQYSGKSNWKYIKELKNSLNIPVIGNGDVLNSDDYVRIIEETGCDGVMIGRASLGNPWIFKSILYKMKNKAYKEPTIIEKIDLCKKHYNLLKLNKPEKLCLNLSKKHFGYYLKGFPKALNWRKKIMSSNSTSDVNNVLSELESFYL